MFSKEMISKFTCNLGKIITHPIVIAPGFLFFTLLMGEPIWFSILMGFMAAFMSFFAWGKDLGLCE